MGHNEPYHQDINYPASILYKSIAGRYRPVRVADGPITARCRFIKNANWVFAILLRFATDTLFATTDMSNFNDGRIFFYKLRVERVI